MLDSLLSRSNQADTTDPPLSEDGTEPDAEDESTPPGTSEPAFNGAHEQSEDELPLDVTFEILKNRRRRLILGYLENEADPTPIGELAEHIAAIENNIDTRQLDSQQRKRVYIGLYQCHLPKMDDAGVIEYNQTRGLVELNDSATPLYEYLDPQEPEPQGIGGHHYLLFTSLFGVIFLITQVSSIPSMTNILVFVICLGMLSLAVLDARTAPSS
jgi:hypothetical protein